ncbi:hypothetical protein FRX31_018625 [Thalictrum thalictroides]|uniref:Uncharacterized protein n=1 Tax=Thalictrum thalictroides TaxID=46969 RepID=A0A7J6W331_THATH|nr:hypothetical protein FRX31_018625 [Thalictrum thalictroides]
MQRQSSSYGDGMMKTAQYLLPTVRTIYSQIFSSTSTSTSFGSSVSFPTSLSPFILKNRASLSVKKDLLCHKEADEDLHEQSVKHGLLNLDLTKRLTLLTQVPLGNHLIWSGFLSSSIINDFRNLCVGDNGNGEGLNSHVSSRDDSDNSPTSVIENDGDERSKQYSEALVCSPKEWNFMVKIKPYWEALIIGNRAYKFYKIYYRPMKPHIVLLLHLLILLVAKRKPNHN